MVIKPIHIRCRLYRGDFRLNVDQHIEPTGVTGIFGESGSGKTSLLRCIAGLERPLDSRIEVDGVVWADSKAGINVPTHERSLAFVFQEPRLFPHLSVQGNLRYAARRAGSSKESFHHVVELLALRKLLKRKADELSGGEAKRVAIARALLRSPSLLLMDEPLASLDARRQRELLPYLDRLQSEATVPVLYVSHSIDEITQLCDQLIVMEGGEIAAHGALQQVLMRTDIGLLGGAEAGVVIVTQRRDEDRDNHLTRLRFSGGELWVPSPVRSEAPRVRVRASDVSLCRSRPADSSILNILPVIVEEVRMDERSSVLVRLRTGEDELLARITRRSQAELSLKLGDKVFAQIKSVAVRSPDARPRGSG